MSTNLPETFIVSDFSCKPDHILYKKCPVYSVSYVGVHKNQAIFDWEIFKNPHEDSNQLPSALGESIGIMCGIEKIVSHFNLNHSDIHTFVDNMGAIYLMQNLQKTGVFPYWKKKHLRSRNYTEIFLTQKLDFLRSIRENIIHHHHCLVRPEIQELKKQYGQQNVQFLKQLHNITHLGANLGINQIYADYSTGENKVDLTQPEKYRPRKKYTPQRMEDNINLLSESIMEVSQNRKLDIVIAAAA